MSATGPESGLEAAERPEARDIEAASPAQGTNKTVREVVCLVPKRRAHPQDDGPGDSPRRALLRHDQDEESGEQPQPPPVCRCWRVPLACIALIAVAGAWSAESEHPVNHAMRRQLVPAKQALDQAVERMRRDSSMLNSAAEDLRDNPVWKNATLDQAIKSIQNSPTLNHAMEELRDNSVWGLLSGATATSTRTNTSTTTATNTSTTITSTTVTSTTVTTTVTTGPATAVTFYMYRAQSDANYTTENVNTADLGGVLWYLHNEVMVLCPRKYEIVRLRRLKVTALKPFAPFVAFDNGKCTAGTCEDIWMKWGYRVGCQSMNTAYGPNNKWFSLPGRCPGSTYKNKTDTCKAEKPGGSCDLDSVLNKKGGCAWHIEDAGEVRINDVTGISKYYTNYQDFCIQGGREYDKVQDKGIKNSFWDGFGDAAKCAWRLKTFQDAFKWKYPNMPADLPAPAWC